MKSISRDHRICNCSDLRGSAAVFACSVRSLQHKLSVADRLRPLKREQLPASTSSTPRTSLP